MASYLLALADMALLPRSPHRVLVLSADAAALRELSQYFADAGVKVERRSSLEPLLNLHDAVRAVVILPDEFEQPGVLAYLAAVGQRHPDLAIVVVTRSPATYDAIVEADGKPLGAIVLFRPAHSWAILEVLRASLRAR